jgi:hypothetical protein
VPPVNGSAVRLFNLASDVKFAGLRVSGASKALADQIQYSLGSDWAHVPTELQTFTAFTDTTDTTAAGTLGRGVADLVEEKSNGAGDRAESQQQQVGADGPPAAAVGGRAGGAALASAPFTPPSAPMVFTAFLLGDKSTGYTLLPQLDAPETGPCKPP